MKKALILVTSMVLLVTGCGKTKEKDEDTIINNDNVASFEEQTVDGIKVSEFNLNYKEGNTNLIALITNTTDSKVHIKYVDVYLYDDQDNEIANAFFYIDADLEANQGELYQAGISSDVTDAKRVEYKVVK